MIEGLIRQAVGMVTIIEKLLDSVQFGIASSQSPTLIEAAIDVMGLPDDVASPPRLTRGFSGERILSDPLRTGAAPLPAARPE